MYVINYDKKAIDFLEKLPIKIHERILLKLDDAQKDPFRYFKKLEGKNEFKFRVGDYRVIAEFDFSNKIINIRKIGHRKNVYEE